MRTRWKILIGVLAALVLALGVNTYLTDRETASAEVTVAGGEIVHLAGGDLQVLDKGPRKGSPIVLIHCFTCSIDWWDGVIPLLDRGHRVIAVDLLGHGGSEKPSSGYSIPNQARVVAQALRKLGVHGAEVVGHSLGGSVAVALAQQSPDLVERVVIIDTPPTHKEADLGLVAQLGFEPVIGQALWQVKPDFAVRKGLEVAFAPGYDVPDAFVKDVDRMTYSAYHDSPDESDAYTKEEGLDRRMRETGKPLLVMMGAKEQIVEDPAARLAEYRRTVPGAQTRLIPGAGHSPNVEKPAETARLLLRFDNASAATTGAHESPSEAGPSKAPHNRQKSRARHEMQEPLQHRGAVR